MLVLRPLFPSRGINPVPAVDLLQVSEYFPSIVVSGCGLCFLLAHGGGFALGKASLAVALARCRVRVSVTTRVADSVRLCVVPML